MHAPVHDDDQGKGRLGEDLAAAHLRGLGWQVLQRNWRCREGEIDIVACEPLTAGRRCLVFVEVKYRSGLGYGTPLEAITAAKLRRLALLSQCWLRDHRGSPRAGGFAQVRIDAIGVLRQPGGAHRIEHVRGITR